MLFEFRYQHNYVRNMNNNNERGYSYSKCQWTRVADGLNVVDGLSVVGVLVYEETDIQQVL